MPRFLCYLLAKFFYCGASYFLVLIVELALCHRLPPRILRWFLDFGKSVHHCFRARLLSNLHGGNKENGKNSVNINVSPDLECKLKYLEDF
jgi:hypothetical protein